MNAIQRLRAFIDSDPELEWLGHEETTRPRDHDMGDGVMVRGHTEYRIDINLAVVPRRPTAIDRLKEAIDG